MTTTNATPIRITAEHYQIESQSKDRSGKVYDLFFNHEIRRWQCSCPDANPAKGNNPNCKHRRRLVEFIKAQMEGSPVQVQASEIVFKAPLAAPALDPIREQLAGMQIALAQQAEMIADLKETVSILQVQQCKTNAHRFELDGRITKLEADVASLASSKAKKRAPRAKKLSARDLAAQEDAANEAKRFQEEQEAARRREAEEAERLAAAEEAAEEFFARLNQLGKEEAGEVEPAGNVPELDLQAELTAWAEDEAKRAPLNRGNDGFSLLRK